MAKAPGRRSRESVDHGSEQEHAEYRTSSRSALAANHLGRFERAAPAMANRLPAGFRSSGQLLRPDQPVGLPGGAARLVQLVDGCLRLPLERLQLDIRLDADARRSFA